jgi:hypothetical protein
MPQNTHNRIRIFTKLGTIVTRLYVLLRPLHRELPRFFPSFTTCFSCFTCTNGSRSSTIRHYVIVTSDFASHSKITTILYHHICYNIDDYSSKYPSRSSPSTKKPRHSISPNVVNILHRRHRPLPTSI